MQKRLERLSREWDMLPRGSRVLCAVSGGADSVCLLAVLYALRESMGFELAAAHYNHTLRGEESRRDEDFVRALVAERFPGVPLCVGSGDVAGTARARGTGLEETARALRYDFLNETARAVGADRIATAHTADDNAETILLHLCRGSGLRGLTGIPPVRGNLIRPLLTTTRAEVEAYLAENRLPHVEDSTNSSDQYARNRVRHQVVPVLEGLYPGFARRLTENADSLRADEAYLSARAEELARNAVAGDRELVIQAGLLAEAPKPIAIRAVRALFARLRGGEDTCRAAHLESVLALCRAEAPSGEVHLPGGLTARREYEKLCLCYDGPVPALEEQPLVMPGVTAAGDWEITCETCIYGGQGHDGLAFWLSRNKAPGLLVRARRTGDALTLPGRPGKSLKKWLVEEKVPRRERESLPVLVCGGTVAGVACLGPDAAFLPEPGEDAWRLRFRKVNL